MLYRDTTEMMSTSSDLQLHHEDDNFLVDLPTYAGKRDQSFSDWIVQVEKIAILIETPKLQPARSNAEGIIYKLIEGMLQCSNKESV